MSNAEQSRGIRSPIVLAAVVTGVFGLLAVIVPLLSRETPERFIDLTADAIQTAAAATGAAIQTATVAAFTPTGTYTPQPTATDSPTEAPKPTETRTPNPIIAVTNEPSATANVTAAPTFTKTMESSPTTESGVMTTVPPTISATISTPMRTDAPYPPPTFTPTEEAQAAYPCPATVINISSRAQIARTQPRLTDSIALGWVEPDQQVTVEDVYPQGTRTRWYRITDENSQPIGWIEDRYLDLSPLCPT